MICDPSPTRMHEPDEEWRRFVDLMLRELHRKGERFREQVEALRRVLRTQGVPETRDDVQQEIDDHASGGAGSPK